VVHCPDATSPVLRPLCGVYHGCGGLFYAMEESGDDAWLLRPEQVTCFRCLKLLSQPGAAP
jgi:hypothetical protein